ncbi:MAG: gliding motility-associated C-terminal domain-containing protein [Sphingobacteriaceae bacterium]|nr:gliding motility-associated C-terminal domain-containing protein [Sphingobacteriaceae bacterium]
MANRVKLLFALVFCLKLSFGQTKFNHLSKDIFGCRVFVENKGQFNNKELIKEPILYGYENGEEHIYFTQSGPVYQLIKRNLISEKEKERIERGKKVKIKPDESHFVFVKWLNANTQIEMEESQTQNHYFTYGGPELNARTFKKITYKNVYNNIDIEYTFPENKLDGIKYNIILHPGANPDDIQIQYSGDVKNIMLKDQEVIVKTNRESITEHVPVSYYLNTREKVKSEFILQNGIIKFKLDPGYDRSRTLVIDPWVTTLTSLVVGNYGFDVDHDGLGNLFVYGGVNQAKIAKYDVVGNLLWTFSGTVIPISWTSQGPGNEYLGNFVVNKNTGKTYVGVGYDMNNQVRIIRLDAAGNYDNWVTPYLYTVEVWDMLFHCSSGTVYEMGGSTIANLSGGIIDQITSTVQVANFTGIPTAGQDFLSTCVDDYGVIFGIYASQGTSVVSNQITRINNSFNGNTWMVPSTYTTFAEAENKASYQGGTYYSNAFNCLAVNANFLFYYDGYNVAAYNKNTGQKVGFTTIPMIAIKQQGGIAVDDCNNVYVGGIDNLFSYYFNGSSFVALNDVQLNTPSVNKFVYDVKLDRATKLLYVCGSGFAGVYSAVNSLTCGANNGLSVTVNCLGLNAASAVATLSTGIPNPTVNYIWTANGNTVAATMSTSAMSNTANLPNGTYTLQTHINAPCGPIFTTTLNIQCCPTVALTSSVSQSGCSYSVNSATVTLTGGGTLTPTIDWNPPPQAVAPNSLSAVGLPVGTNTIVFNFGFNCINTSTVNVLTQAPPVTFTLNNLTGSNSITCIVPVVTLQAVSNYTFGTLSYSWTSPSFTSGLTTVQILTANTLTLTVTDPLTGCLSQQIVAIALNTTAPTNFVNPTNQFVTCNSGAPVTFSGTVTNPTINIQHDWYSPFNPLPGGVPIATSNNTLGLLSGAVPPGVYTLQTTNLVNGCISLKTVTVTSLDAWPTFSLNSPTNFSVGCNPLHQTTISIVNPVSTQTPPATCSYTFLAPSFTGVVTPSVVLGNNTSTVTTIPGTWTIIVQDNSNFCRTTIQVPIIQNTVAPNVSSSMFTQTLTCKNPTVIATGTTTTPNTIITWNVPSTPPTLSTPSVEIGNPSNGPNTSTTSLTYANFTVVATNSLNACQSTSVVTIHQNFKPPISNPTISIATPTAIYCTVGSNPVVLTTGSSTTTSGGGPGAFVANPCWEGPSPQTPTCGPSSYSCYVPGVYSLTVEDAYNGCKHTGTVNVLDKTQPPVLQNQISTATIQCGEDQTRLQIQLTGTNTSIKYWIYQYPVGASFNPSTAITPNGGNLLLSGTSSPSIDVSLNGRYYYYVTNTLTGCRISGVYEVKNGNLNTSLKANPELGFAPLDVQFNAESNGLTAVNIVWNFGNGLSQISNDSETINTLYNSPGTYQVFFIASKGKCIDTAYKTIRVEMPSKMQVPNIFTPNNDGVNDQFFLHVANLTELKAIIFDRWGNQVFEMQSESGNIQWDGTNYTGVKCSSGVYLFSITGIGTDGKTYHQKGTITLLR